MAEDTRVNVVIIGGGLAGLSAALRLKDSGKDVKYVVLEAEEDRLGGRTRSEADDFDLDFGGGYVGSSQNYLQYLLRRFQIPTIKEYLPEDKVWLFESSDGERMALPGDDPLAIPGDLNAALGLLKLDTLTMEVRDNLEHLENSLSAPLDGQTVQDFIDQQLALYAEEQKKPPAERDPSVGMSPLTAEAFLSSVRSAFSLEPRELSMFFLLYYAATSGSYAALVDVVGGDGAAEGHRLMFGTSHLVGKLAEEVSQGGDIIPDARVDRIERGVDGITVVAGARRFRADHVIVAMSPPVSAKIEYRPPLNVPPGAAPDSTAVDPAGILRMKLCDRMANAQARTIKGFVRFKEPFWRAQGRMGFFLSTSRDDARPVDWALDNVWDPNEFTPIALSIEQRTKAPRYRLMTFIVGDAATYWTENKTLEERARAVIDHLQSVFEFRDDQLWDPANILESYKEFNWVEAGIPAPAAMMPPDTLLPFGSALRAPVGRIHWACSESGREWAGYMNGAVESGFRAAAEIIRELPLTTAETAAAEGTTSRMERTPPLGVPVNTLALGGPPNRKPRTKAPPRPRGPKGRT